MRISSPSLQRSKLQRKTQKRLQELARYRFIRLESNGNQALVGLAGDPWDAEEMSSALERIRSLAADPAKGGKINDASIEEATVALTAENLEVFEGLKRDQTGRAEFLDSKGESWDVKSPLSPPPHQNWHFSPHHQLQKVRKDFSNGDKVLLNLSRVNPQDRDKTLTLFSKALTANEKGQLLILTDSPI